LPRAFSAHFRKVRGRFPRGFGPVFVPVRNRAQMRIFLVLKLHRNQKPRKAAERIRRNEHNQQNTPKGYDAMNTTSKTPLADAVARDTARIKLPPKSRCLTPGQAAEIYGVPRRSLKRLWQERRLPVYRLGHRSILIDAKDMEAFLAHCRQDALRV